MKAHEIITNEETITEWSDIHKGIKKELRDKGYKYLGSGVDQMAFLEPGTGYVLKVFGTQEELAGRPNKFSNDHKMFFKFAKFCMKNASNPFLPKFFGYESFVYDNSNYLQIRQERLRKSGDLGYVVEALAGYLSEVDSATELFNDALREQATREQALRDEANGIDVEYDWVPDPTYPNIEYCIDELGVKGTRLLLKTIKQLMDMGYKHNWDWDLHNENIMCRGKIPVLVDPWVAP